MVPFEAALHAPAPDALARVTPGGPACCTPGFCRKASGLLDTLRLAQDVIRDAIALVEEETLP